VNPNAKERAGWGYAGPIAISALAHVAFIYLLLFALPRWFTAETTPPPAYSVNIVDNIPAGDLGTHTLPRLSGGNPPQPEESSEPETEKEPEPSKVEPPAASTAIEAKNDDPNAFALNKPTATEEPTPAPTATATPTPEPTATIEASPVPVVATPPPTPEPTARPTPRPRPKRTHRPHPTARPTPPPRRPAMEPRGKHHRLGPPKPAPKVMFAHAEVPTKPAAANIRERLREIREELLREHLRQSAQNARNRPGPEGDDSSDEGATAKGASNGASGGGPVLANVAGGGKGYGIGSGTGSLGMLKDPEFLLYYQKVEERIKDAWSFYGGNRNLTTSVEFAIGPDGKVAGISVKQSSHNTSFDQSVVRAVQRAAPFPPPPEKYRDQFAQGIQAVFKLGELRS
jgi:TonB family protein